jgi:predicted DNA-binding transcriptional regulator AlpA
VSALDRDDIERLARRVAELVAATPPPAVRYVDAAEVARVLGVERDWVYAHARELGAVRLGGGQGRLRFDLQEVRRVVAADRQSGPSTARVRSFGRTGESAATELTSSSRTTKSHPSRRRPEP